MLQKDLYQLGNEIERELDLISHAAQNIETLNGLNHHLSVSLSFLLEKFQNYKDLAEKPDVKVKYLTE